MRKQLWKLPCATDLIASNLSVSGLFFLECFAGQAMITVGLLMMNVPCLRPLDSKFGDQFDVLSNGHILLSLIHAQRIISAHFATPCQSKRHGQGCHSSGVSRDLQVCLAYSEKQQFLVDIGNQLLAFTISCCVGLHALGSFFCMENPELSWLWLQGDSLMLSDL